MFLEATLVIFVCLIFFFFACLLVCLFVCLFACLFALDFFFFFFFLKPAKCLLD